MSIITDYLQTVFQVSGISSVVGAFARVSQATQQLDYAEQRLAATGTLSALNGLINATRQLGMANLMLSQQAFGAFEGLVRAGEQAIQTYSELAKSIQTVADLSGSTLRESAQAVALFRGAGISDTTAIRDMLRLGRDMSNPAALGALSRLGVVMTPQKSGVQVLKETLAALDRMPDSLLKTSLEVQAFGQRNVVALQTLRMMTHEQRDSLTALGDAVDTKVLPAFTRFQASMNILGLTVLVKIVGPLASKLLPVFQKVVDFTTNVVKGFDKLNEKTGGLAMVGLVFGGIAASIVLIGTGIVYAIAAFQKLNEVLKITDLLEAIADAFSGNWAALAAGLGVAAAGGLALWGLNKWGQSASQSNSGNGPAATMQDAANTFAGAVNDFKSLMRGSGPAGLNPVDISAIERMGALKAIG